MVGLALAILLLGCGSAPVTPVPAASPTAGPTIAPLATATSLAAGPLSGIGPLGRATYETPAGFAPAFSFEIRSDAWRSATEPDPFGFVLVTPNLARAHAILALARPVASTVADFEQELADHGLLSDGTAGPAASVADVSVGGSSARSFSLTRTTSVDAFSILNATGQNLTAVGGQLAENRIVYVTTPDGPFLLLLSLDGDRAAEARFVFESILTTLAFP